MVALPPGFKIWLGCCPPAPGHHYTPSLLSLCLSRCPSRPRPCAPSPTSPHPRHAAGILVLNAREGGPAWRAGIRGTSRDDYGRLVLGDIITRINGGRIRNSSDQYRVLDKAVVGQDLDIEVLRADAEAHLIATLEANS